MTSATRVDLTQGPIKKHLWDLGAPMVIGFSSVTIFSVADTYFVGQLGTAELASMALTFPVTAIFGSFAMGLGVGTASLLARTIGTEDEDHLKQRTRDALLLAMAIATVVSIGGLTTIVPVFTALGADDATLPGVVEYMTVWYLGMAFLMIPMTGNACLRGLGDSRTPAAIMIVSGGLNVLLDPVFIFGVGPLPAMGIRGAAIASVCARAATMLVGLGVLAFQKRVVALSFPRPGRLLSNWKELLYIAVPATTSQLMEPICFAILTTMLAEVSSQALAAFGAGSKLMRLATIPMMAVSAGLVPLVGQNLVRHRGRVKQTIRFATRFSLAWGFAAWILMATVAWPLAGLFSTEPEVVSSLVAFLRVALVGLTGEGAFKVASATVIAAGRPIPAMGMMALRLFGLVLPLSWLGRLYGGPTGMFAGMGCGYLLGGLIAWVWTCREYSARDEP